MDGSVAPVLIQFVKIFVLNEYHPYRFSNVDIASICENQTTQQMLNNIVIFFIFTRLYTYFTTLFIYFDCSVVYFTKNVRSTLIHAHSIVLFLLSINN